jgi:hypothetical protein
LAARNSLGVDNSERSFNVGLSLRSKAARCSERSDLRTCYRGVFYGTLSPFSLQLGIRGTELTELRVQEDPMAIVEIPESTTTQTVTGCGYGRGGRG